MRDSATLTTAAPVKLAVRLRSTISSRLGSSCETVSTAVGVWAERTWMSHSRRTAKLPFPFDRDGDLAEAGVAPP